MAGSRTIFILHGLGLIFLAAGTISLMVSIFTSHWLVSSVGGSGFQSAGLWKVCFARYTVTNDRFKPIALSGCYSLDDPVFGTVSDWIHPSWLKAVKGLLVTSMFLNVGSLFCCAFYLLLQRDRVMIPLIILSLISNIFISCGTTLFRYSAFDRDWLPLPDSNELSTSFNAATAAIFLHQISLGIHGIQGLMLYCQRSRSMAKT